MHPWWCWVIMFSWCWCMNSASTGYLAYSFRSLALDGLSLWLIKVTLSCPEGAPDSSVLTTERSSKLVCMTRLKGHHRIRIVEAEGTPPRSEVSWILIESWELSHSLVESSKDLNLQESYEPSIIDCFHFCKRSKGGKEHKPSDSSSH